MGNINGKESYLELALQCPNLTIDIYTLPVDCSVAYCIFNFFKFVVDIVSEIVILNFPIKL
jgi:hypothetical protein